MIAFFSCVSVINAQSSVTFLTKKMASTDTKIVVNGNKSISLNGNVVKTLNDASFAIPYKVISPCYRQLNIKDAGKVMFSVNIDFTKVSTCSVTKYASEIQLNLTPNSKHYVLVTNKGLKDFQLKEISEKEALKMMSNKKMLRLPTIDL